jgi:hypothetical protein
MLNSKCLEAQSGVVQNIFNGRSPTNCRQTPHHPFNGARLKETISSFVLAVHAASIVALHYGLTFRSYLSPLQTLPFHFALSSPYTSVHFASIAVPYLHRKPCCSNRYSFFYPCGISTPNNRQNPTTL